MNKKILFSRMRRSYFFKIGLTGVLLIFICCYILPLFIEWDPVTNSLQERFLPPDGLAKGLEGHILGTDQLGRDLLIRLLIGGQFSFRLAFFVVLLQTTIGATMGILSGYFGGWVDVVIMRACDALMSMPALIMAIAVLAVLGTSPTNMVIVLTLSGWVQLCKVTRNNVRVVRGQEFVLASKALGAKGLHIMFRQILPNVTTHIVVIASQRIGLVILLEASLSFLNLGIQPPMPSWGNMIATGREFLMTQPWLIMVPGFGLMLSVLSFNFLGDGIRDILDTKRKI